MRVVLLVVLLGACASAEAAGPKWPKPTPHEHDGGESIAPRAAARAIAAVEAAAEEDKASEAKEPHATKPAAESGTGDKAGSAPPPDEVMMTEELVIEVED